MDSIIEDIQDDKDRKFELINEGYKFESLVNYPNNKKLVKQEVEIDKNLNIKKASILDKDGKLMMKMTFDKIEINKGFDKNYFDLNNLLNNSTKKEETPKQDNTSSTETNTNQPKTTEEDTEKENTKTETKQTTTIEDIIYPMYLPDNTYLTSQEKVETESGERLILTFEGDNPFILVEETIHPSDTSLIIPTSGNLEFLSDVIGVVNDNSISWDSNGIEYYVISKTMETSELIEIARSISVLPVSK